METIRRRANDQSSTSVLGVIADGRRRRLLALPPLAWSVDPAALDALLTGEGAHEITFEYCE